MKPKTKLKIERIQDIETLEALKEDWNALLAKNEIKTVELTHEWQSTYWKYFHEKSELFVLVVKDAGSIVGIAPLKLTYIRRFGIKIRTLEFITAEESNYQDFITEESNKEALEYILDCLISNRELWDVLNLRHIPESTTTRLLLNKLDDSLLLYKTEVEKCIFLKIDKTWEEYTKDTNKKRKK